MGAGTTVTFAVKSCNDLDACFEATCAEIFATTCHLVAGDRDRAEELMIDVFLSIRRAVETGSGVAVDHDWIVATALRRVLGHEEDRPHEALTALERAVLELHLVDGRDIDTVAATLGLTSAEVATSLARYEDHSKFSAGLVADLLRQSELWLDDATRRRARYALHNSAAPATSPSPAFGARATQPLDRRVVFAGIGILIALGAIGLVWILPQSNAGGVQAVLAAPFARPPRYQQTTSTTSGATPIGSAAPVLRTPVDEPGFVIGTVPLGFHQNGASERVDPFVVGQFELWAQAGSTRTSGRWLTLTTRSNAPVSTTFVSGASREVIGGNRSVTTTTPDGVTTLTVQPATGGQFSLTAFGFSNDELRQLAAGITLLRGEAVFDAELDGLRTGLEPLAKVPMEYGEPQSQILGGRRRWATYLSTDESQFIRVTTKSTTPNDVVTSEFLLLPSGDALAPAAPLRTIELSDRLVSVSASPDGGGSSRPQSLIQWPVGAETVTMSGNVGLSMLLAAVPSVRRATVEEWTDQFRFDATDLPRTGPPPLSGELVRIGRTTTVDGSRWTISMSDDPVGVRIEVRNDSVAGFMTDAALEADAISPTPDNTADRVTEYVSMAATLLVITTDHPSTATGVRISLVGSTSTTVPLVPVDGAGLLAAGHAFSEVAEYTVELVDATGATVRTLSR